MPHVARVKATADEIVMGRDNVSDDERPEGRARGGRRQSRAERHGAPGARRRELDDTNALCRGDILIELQPKRP